VLGCTRCLHTRLSHPDAAAAAADDDDSGSGGGGGV